MSRKALSYNEGKPKFNLLDFKSLHPMIEALEYGAHKYSTWKSERTQNEYKGSEFTPEEIRDRIFTQKLVKIADGTGNWKKEPVEGNNINSALRHLTAYSDGEKLDPESGVQHLGHAMCRIMFEIYHNGKEEELGCKLNTPKSIYADPYKFNYEDWQKQLKKMYADGNSYIFDANKQPSKVKKWKYYELNGVLYKSTDTPLGKWVAYHFHTDEEILLYDLNGITPLPYVLESINGFVVACKKMPDLYKIDRFGGWLVYCENDMYKSDLGTFKAGWPTYRFTLVSDQESEEKGKKYRYLKSNITGAVYASEDYTDNCKTFSGTVVQYTNTQSLIQLGHFAETLLNISDWFVEINWCENHKKECVGNCANECINDLNS